MASIFRIVAYLVSAWLLVFALGAVVAALSYDSRVDATRGECLLAISGIGIASAIHGAVLVACTRLSWSTLHRGEKVALSSIAVLGFVLCPVFLLLSERMLQS